MGRIVRWLVLSVLLMSGATAADAKRKAVPIGGEWNLSGGMLERTKVEGKRVVQMTAKGDAKLKQGRNPLLGPWVLEASAEIIECDFAGKRFIIYGPYTISKKQPDGGTIEVSGEGPDSKVELPFQGGAIRTTGPNKTRVGEPPRAIPKARKAAQPAEPEK